MRNLAVAVLGNRNSGKTHTWNTLFGRTVRTGKDERTLSLGGNEQARVFLVSGSPEERNEYVGDLIGKQAPRIVLCSMQYIDTVRDTLQFFEENDYFLFLHWLNPGFSDAGHQPDRLGLYQRIGHMHSLSGTRDATVDAADRVREMRDFIRGWASSRRLVEVL